MATRNQQSDSPSLNLFPEDPTENSSTPGDSQPQKAARKSSRGTGVQVVQQPMSSIATKAVSGAITRQMMLTWLKIVQVIQQQPKADVYQIPMPVLMEFLGDKNNYARLKTTLRALNATSVEWNEVTSGGSQWTVSSLLSQAKIIRSPTQNIVEVSFPPDIGRGIRELEQFSELNLMMAKELSSQASLNLYRIAVAYESNPSKVTFRRTPEDWDMYLRGKPKDSSSPFEYKYFKRDTLLKAVDDVNRFTHLTLELIEHKKGRVVVEIQFRIHQKKKNIEPNLLGPAGNEATMHSEAELRKLGVRAVDAVSLVANYGSERVDANIAYFKKRRDQEEGASEVKSPIAYLKAAIKNHYADGMVVDDASHVANQPKKGDAKVAQKRREIAMQDLLTARRNQASALFLEMTRRTSDEYWHEYLGGIESSNHKTLIGAARKSGLESKIVQVSFYNWLAEKLWGIADDKALNDFILEQSSGQ